MNKEFGKPEANSDVLNREPKTLLIGFGWVGQYVHKYFTQADIVTPSRGLLLRRLFDETGKADFPDLPNYTRYLNFDKDGFKSLEKGYNGAEQTERWEIAFISTPSPMREDGSCDTSFVEEAVKNWAPFVDLFICRSTVTPGTCDRLSEKYNTRVVMQPEYVGETLDHPFIKPHSDPFIILGGKPEDTKKAGEAWMKVLHANATIRQVTALTAELCKYMENSFLGVKVLFVNEFRQLAEMVGVDFLELREAWLEDPRIGRSHSMAYKENPGFSGKCLPKDLNSIAHYARTKAISPLRLIEAALEINADMRKDCKNSVPLLPTKK